MKQRIDLLRSDGKSRKFLATRRRTTRQKCAWYTTLFVAFACFLAARLFLIDVSMDDYELLNLHSNNNHAKLRLDWNKLPLTSPMAKRINSHQQNCSLPLGTFQMRNRMGLGSDLHVWSQVLCNAMDERVRVWSLLPWQWRDEEACESDETVSSDALKCYFSSTALQCPGDSQVRNETTLHEISSPYNSKCPSILGDNATMDEIAAFRASAMEYLFHSVSPVVIQEAERQINLLFPNGKVPPHLITVQIRWGDKKKEMKLLPAHDYVNGVRQILKRRPPEHNKGVSIYLATEDPKAVEAFRQAAPPDWNIHVDQYFYDMLPHRNKEEDVYNQGPKTARQTKGRAGLVALGSLLVAMEANDFVLTTASNWSRLMNELRRNVIDPICNGCTRMIDLKFGEW